MGEGAKSEGSAVACIVPVLFGYLQWLLRATPGVRVLYLGPFYVEGARSAKYAHANRCLWLLSAYAENAVAALYTGPEAIYRFGSLVF